MNATISSFLYPILHKAMPAEVDEVPHKAMPAEVDEVLVALPEVPFFTLEKWSGIMDERRERRKIF